MAKRERVSKGRVKWDRDPQEQVHGDTRTKRERTRSAQEKAALEAELDELMDEIDEVLEENAEEFVNAFVQRGGE
jgi:ubiquitin-like protein Pup